tara:strand:- start:3896 stop:4090 length:195 start_codon:yes stop_codon:yes gene_type:complete
LAGVVTGADLGSIDDEDEQMADIHLSELYTFVDDYCQKRPFQDLTGAASNFVYHLRRQHAAQKN